MRTIGPRNIFLHWCDHDVGPGGRHFILGTLNLGMWPRGPSSRDPGGGLDLIIPIFSSRKQLPPQMPAWNPHPHSHGKISNSKYLTLAQKCQIRLLHKNTKVKKHAISFYYNKSYKTKCCHHRPGCYSQIPQVMVVVV